MILIVFSNLFEDLDESILSGGTHYGVDAVRLRGGSNSI
jgi:hypothetical protein